MAAKKRMTVSSRLTSFSQVNGVAPGGTLGTELTGADHAGSYVFLAFDRARGITGSIVHSDGGIAAS